MIDHVERVADAVSIDARPLAYLHDVLERSDTAAEELYELALTEEEWSVLTLLTRRPRESYAAYVMRVARADGSSGRIARAIKLADLDDHLRTRTTSVQFPNYAWARTRILASQRAHGELIQLYASRDVRRGRNELCTCGSGRKWKHCHGRT